MRSTTPAIGRAELLNEGTDTVNVSNLVNFTLPANVENLVLVTGTNGTGNGLVNSITGNLLDNRLDGAGGADLMAGQVGSDTYVVDNAGDRVIEAAGQGFDTVLTSVTYTLTAGSEIEELRADPTSSTTAINLTGNEFGNTIRGNNGANVITGARGADILTGNGAADTFVWRSLDETGVSVATMDLITDFNRAQGDRIDVSQVDPSVFDDGINQFTFIGQNAFSGTPGEINFVHVGNETIIQFQTGVGADIEGGIRITGIVTPDASWFVL